MLDRQRSLPCAELGLKSGAAHLFVADAERPKIAVLAMGWPAAERLVTIQIVVLIHVTYSATVELEANFGKPGASANLNMDGRFLIPRLDGERRHRVRDRCHNLLEKLKSACVFGLLSGEHLPSILMKASTGHIILHHGHLLNWGGDAF